MQSGVMLFWLAGYRNNGLVSLLLVKLSGLVQAQKFFKISHVNSHHYCCSGWGKKRNKTANKITHERELTIIKSVFTLNRNYRRTASRLSLKPALILSFQLYPRLTCRKRRTSMSSRARQARMWLKATSMINPTQLYAGVCGNNSKTEVLVETGKKCNCN